MAETKWVTGVKKTLLVGVFFCHPIYNWFFGPTGCRFVNELQGFNRFFLLWYIFVHLFRVVAGGQILPSCLVTGGKHTITHLPGGFLQPDS